MYMQPPVYAQPNGQIAYFYGAPHMGMGIPMYSMPQQQQGGYQQQQHGEYFHHHQQHGGYHHQGGPPQGYVEGGYAQFPQHFGGQQQQQQQPHGRDGVPLPPPLQGMYQGPPPQAGFVPHGGLVRSDPASHEEPGEKHSARVGPEKVNGMWSGSPTRGPTSPNPQEEKLPEPTVVQSHQWQEPES